MSRIVPTLIVLSIPFLCQADEPKYFLEIKDAQKVVARLPYGITCPKMKATEWTIVAAQLPLEAPGVEEARAEEVATNAVSYGSAVPLTDVRIIALALARAGAQLRRICPFRESGGRAHVVQVIGSSMSDPLPPLSVKDLESIGPGAPPPCPSGPALAR